MLTKLIHTTIINPLKTIFPYNFVFYEKNKPLILGRWNNHYCNSKTNRKIDYANIDHCGPCGLESGYYAKSGSTTNTTNTTYTTKTTNPS